MCNINLALILFDHFRPEMTEINANKVFKWLSIKCPQPIHDKQRSFSASFISLPFCKYCITLNSFHSWKISSASLNSSCLVSVYPRDQLRFLLSHNRKWMNFCYVNNNKQTLIGKVVKQTNQLVTWWFNYRQTL